MGVQFAGAAACLALVNLTFNENFARDISRVLLPVCTLGMLFIWSYAVVKTPQAVTAPLRPGEDASLAEALAD